MKTVKNRYVFLVAFLWMLALSIWVPGVNAVDDNLPKIVLKGVEWKSIVFGQSTSGERNTIKIENQTITLTAGNKEGTATGGKIANSHDGISYFYTEVPSSKNFELTAKIKVNFFAKPTPDGQEGFGIMARDAIGNALDSSVFASNMVTVGTYKGALQSVSRNNVKDVSGSGAAMEGIFKFGERPANDGSATYVLKLRKTNTGYHVAVDNSAEKIYYRPKMLEMLDPKLVYVGFFTARVASIIVSDINFKTSDVATDPPGVPEPAPQVTPVFKVLSLPTASTSNYDLQVTANVKGKIEIKQNGAPLYTGATNGADAIVKSTTLVLGNNGFDLVFTPDTAENVSSTKPISLQHTVTYKTYGTIKQGIYVAPNGKETATGSKKDPLDIYTAVQFVQPGQTIYLLGGIYNLTLPVIIPKGNNGVEGKLKVLTAAGKQRPVLDFGAKSQGVTVSGDYWKLYGFDITKASSDGLMIHGNHNLVELINSYANGNVGIFVQGFATDKIERWASYNTILNCTAYDNRDASENNADGFSAKNMVGVGNVFRGCISHNNTDDGFDFYAKLETGAIGAVLVEDCIAYDNGTLTNGTKTKGDGNGFKMGGEGLAVKHILRNSLAFKNKKNGVTSNSNPAFICENVTSVDNKESNFNFSYYTNAKLQFAAKNNISFRTATGAPDTITPEMATVDNFFYNGTDTVNSSGKKVTAVDFKSVTPALYGRKANGTITPTNFMALTSASKVTVGYQPKK